MRWMLGTATVALVLSATFVGPSPTFSLVDATTPPNCTPPANVFLVAKTGTTYDGCPGRYPTIQGAVQAVDAASASVSPGKKAPSYYILVAPGDYKTSPDQVSAPPGGPPAGVLITTPHTWLVGMNRNTVIVDGTDAGPPCSTATADQNFGPGYDAATGHEGDGLNGIMVWKASDDWVENLTACNFLGGSGGDGGTGNEIWWNGGANSGTVFSGTGYWGKYMTATSTYYHDETTAAQYGIFSSNWDGGLWNHSYASNFNDSGYYIGACQDRCNQVVDHAWAEYNALGYSGSNSGGVLLVEHSQFDNNEDGFDTNSQNGDNPPPQNGACVDGERPPVAGAHTCWVFYDNNVHDNNDPNVPTAGSAAAGPVGTGLSLAGARNDTVMDNTFTDNDAWGTILVPYPDSGPPCSGGTQLQAACIFDESGDAIIDNTYVHDGSYGNPTNGDIAATNLEPGPTDCFSGNRAVGGPLTTSPPLAETLYPRCTGQTVPPDLNPLFFDEVACDSGNGISIVGPVQGSTFCLPGSTYPRQTQVVMHPLPGTKAGSFDGHSIPALENPSSTALATMPNPCQGVPVNPWCPPPSGSHPRGNSHPRGKRLSPRPIPRPKRPTGTRRRMS